MALCWRVASFLASLVEGANDRLLMNARTGHTVATRLEAAFDSESRRRGLLGRTAFEEGAALIIAPCSSIHMFFMQFPIDVLFVARDGRIVKVCGMVRPWRIAVSWGGFAAIELPAGTTARTGDRPGDYLRVIRNNESQRQRTSNLPICSPSGNI